PLNTGERYLALSAGELRLALEDLYAEYSACLNEERFEDWPEFFTDPCLYKIVPRENFERGLPLATWLCESKGYLADRVTAIRKTAVDRKSTRLNSSHDQNSYADFCLKQKK